MQSISACSSKEEEEIAQLKAQVTTLEELLQLYQESATEQEHRLQTMLHQLQDRAQQLEHSQTTLQTLQTILDSMGDAVVVIDQKGYVLFLNTAAQQLLQKEPIERSFRHWTTNHDIFGPDGTTPYPVKEQPLTKAIQGYSIDTAEMRIVERSTCQSKWFSVNAKPIKSNEQVIGAVAVFRDVGHQKKTEEILKKSKVAAQQQAQLLKETLTQLKGTQASLIQSEKMSSLGTTVAGIAHEINNPVNFIHGNLAHTQQAFQDLLTIIKQFQAAYPQTNSPLAELLEEMDISFLERDIPNMLASMKAGTQRIREVIQSLRLFSHLDEADLKAVDIHKGIDSVLMILQSQLKKQPNREAINVICHYGELPLIECHARQLNQVFVNLMSNAIDALSGQVSTSQTGFSKAGSPPTITIQTEIIAENVVITLSDNGIGIPEEIRDQIFDPFFTTKPVGKGTGLGLSSCYQIIVETHKGSLQCLSQVGEGTQFVIELPLSQSL